MKKVISLMLSFVMLLSITVGFDLSVSAATNHTQKEAVNWINSQIGKSLDYDGVYGAQCVDFIYYYYQYLGVTVQGGNGSDYAWNTLPSGWKRINYYNGFTPQGGDIGVWSGANHVGIWASSSVFVDQNSNGRSYVASNTNLASIGLSLSGMTCVIRPDFSLATPTNLNVQTIDEKLNISWNASAGAISYVVYIYSKSNCSEYVYKNEVTTTYINNISVKPGRYWIYVHAINSSGASAGCGPFHYLGCPTNVNVDQLGYTMKVTWTGVEGANCYDVIVTDPSGTTNWYHTGETNKKITVSKVGNYTIDVQSLYRPNGNTDGQIVGAHSKVVTYNLNSLETELTAPTAKAVVNTNGGFTISWNAVSGADKYDVYIDNGTGYKILRTVTGTSTTTGTAHYGKEYSYKVRAVNSKNSAITSAFSSAVSAINNKRLVTPTAKAIVNANGGFTISWNTVVGADKYDVYIDNGAGYKLLRTVTGTSTTTGTAHYGKKYSYKVRAVNSKNSAITSAFSSAVTATNNVRLVTPVPKIKVNANASFTLSWNTVIGADTYEIYLKTANGSYRLLKTVNTNSATIGGAVKGKTYTYKVRAINSKNNAVTSAFSSELSGIY